MPSQNLYRKSYNKIKYFQLLHETNVKCTEDILIFSSFGEAFNMKLLKLQFLAKSLSKLKTKPK